MDHLSAVVVEDHGLKIKERRWVWEDIKSISRRNLLVAGSVTIAHVDGPSVTAWGFAAASRKLHASLETGLFQWAQQEIQTALQQLHEFLDKDRYLTRQIVEEFVQRHTPIFTGRLRVVDALARHGDPAATSLLDLIRDFKTTVARRNSQWNADEQDRWSEFFDTVESTPLTAEQRKAVVDFDNRNLLVAAAGSGKSSTLVAKIAYAVRKGLFGPEEILALAFNKKAAEELSERIRARLADMPGHESIRSETFHGLGYRVLSAQKKQTIESEREKRIEEIYDHLKSTHPEFRREVVRFVLNFMSDLRDRTEFSTYQEYLDYLITIEIGGGSKGRRVRTLSGHNVASHEEMKIANWLFTHGVRFEYEKTYPHVEATQERRGYTPDFYYPDINVWHEHFGVDAQGRPAPCIGDPARYQADRAWKRETHGAFQTALMETTSANFADDTVFEELERLLRVHGQPLKEMSPEEIDARLVKKDEHRDLTALITTFISHWKSKEISYEELAARGSSRDRAFLSICKQVYDAYRSILERDRRIDFDDMIIGATKAIESGEWSSPYKLILVDEFQDISTARAKLVRALLAQHANSVLFCVGDDWQSINGFAGSELAIMRNFEREFGPCVTNYLTKTFRSNQGISTTAKVFVEKNPDQLKKDVVAHDKSTGDCLRFVRYGSREELPAVYEGIARELADVGDCSLMVLGRYRKSEGSLDLGMFGRVAANIRVEFNTMHGSKGLQADYVILDSVEARGKYAFPSTITDDSVLRMVMPEKEPFLHAEERRLMYVALTRAKHRVFILTQGGSESPFVGELAGQGSGATSFEVFACPYCKNGMRVQREGKHGRFWSCSRFPECEGKPRRAVVVQ